MNLIGQFDSPFTRRIGIMLRLYGIAFDHQPWSVFGDAEKLAKVNPLMRVPTLVLTDGDVLIETQMIMDYLDRRVGPARSLIPQETPYRHRTQKLIALASGISDKSVILFYETRLHDTPSSTYVDRLTKQILGALEALETARAAAGSPYWDGDVLNQADIAVACSLRHLREAFPEMFSPAHYPALALHMPM